MIYEYITEFLPERFRGAKIQNMEISLGFFNM